MPGGRVENWSLFLRLLLRGGNRFARAVLSCDLPDMTLGYRVWGSEALSTTLAAGNTGLVGYAIQIEMAWSHWVREGQVRPTPICFVERTRVGPRCPPGSRLRPLLVSCAFARENSLQTQIKDNEALEE